MKTQKILFQLVYSTEELFSKKEKKPLGYADYFLTDIKIHASQPRKSTPLIRQIEKSIRSGKYNRTYSDEERVCNDIDHTVKISLPLFEDNISIQRAKDRAMKENKIFRIYAPRSGLLVYPGEDAIEFIKGHPELVEKMKRLDKREARRKF